MTTLNEINNLWRVKEWMTEEWKKKSADLGVCLGLVRHGCEPPQVFKRDGDALEGRGQLNISMYM